MDNVIELHPQFWDAAASGRQIAITAFVDIEHENKSRPDAARLAAKSLMSDMADGGKQENIEELTAFIDQLLTMYDTSTEKVVGGHTGTD